MQVSFASRLPETSCKIPMAGTQEFKERKAKKETARQEQADTFNGKPAEAKAPTILEKVTNAFKKFEETFIY